MSFDKCDICEEEAFMRCDKHNRCDKCGMTKEESIKNNISLVHREEGLICDNCFKKIVDERLKTFEGSTQYEDDIMCPYCGSKYGDCWEWKESGEYDCDDCKNKFEFCRNIETSYSTSKLDASSGGSE